MKWGSIDRCEETGVRLPEESLDGAALRLEREANTVGRTWL